MRSLWALQPDRAIPLTPVSYTHLGWLEIRFPQLDLLLRVKYADCTKFTPLSGVKWLIDYYDGDCQLGSDNKSFLTGKYDDNRQIVGNQAVSYTHLVRLTPSGEATRKTTRQAG